MGNSEVARTNTANLNAESLDTRPISAKETAAWAALEKCAGRTMNDLEWGQERHRLLAFVSILRDWRQKGTSNAATLKAA